MKTTKLTDEFSYEDFQQRYGQVLPLFVLDTGGVLTVVKAEEEPAFTAGQTIVALVLEQETPAPLPANEA